jgi:uncharacterized protein YbjT (DUF2867 family)
LAAADHCPAVDAVRRAGKKRANETFLEPLFRLLPGNWKSIAARDVAIALLAEALSPTHEGCKFIVELRERAARQAE